MNSENACEIFSEAQKVLKGKTYLIAVPIPFYRSEDGAIWIDGLWYKDLVAHLDYIGDLKVLAPCLRFEAQTGLKKIQPHEAEFLDFVPLPAPNSVGRAVISFPKTVIQATKAVWSSDIVHSGMAGWPIPLGMIVNPLAILMRKPLIIVVESAFWRVANDKEASLRRKVRASLTEAFARWSVGVAKLAVFTHRAYKKSLSRREGGATMISPASWILEQDILSVEDAKNTWEKKSTTKPRFLIAARLTPEKGISLVMNALEVLEKEGCAIHLDVIGEGELFGDCQRIAESLETVEMNLLDPVEYGPEFFSVLRNYSAIVVPSLSDEQPRIIFDAYSQAVPVIASETSGHVDIVDNGQTGWLFQAGSSKALCAVLKKAAMSFEELQNMGEMALCRSGEYTHKSMHAKRAKALMYAL